MGEDELQLERNLPEDRHQSQELVAPGQEGAPRASPPPPALLNADLQEAHELSAVTVLTLLDQLVRMLDAVQEKQLSMERWQQEMEGSVRRIHGDMNRLLKSNAGAAGDVAKLVEKNRRVSAAVKDVRDKMERQGVAVRRLEQNHAHLVHRDRFRVLIFQDEKEIPSTVFLKDPSVDPEKDSLSPDPNRSQDEDLHVVQLSSDEDLNEDEEEEEEDLEMMENPEKTRAEKIKSSSLRKVDSLKRAFSRENFEKKMNKIVSAEKRDKIKKSLSQKNRGGSFKIFRKIREGEEPGESFSEVHAQLAPDQEEEEAAEKKDEEKEEVEEEEEVEEKEEKEKEEKEEDEEEEKEKEEKEEEEKEKEEKEKEEKEKEEEEKEEARPDDGREGVSDEYALSDTLPQDSSQNAAVHGDQEKQEEKETGDAKGTS